MPRPSAPSPFFIPQAIFIFLQHSPSKDFLKMDRKAGKNILTFFYNTVGNICQNNDLKLCLTISFLQES